MVVNVKIIKKAKAGTEIKPTIRQQAVAQMVAKGSIGSKAKILSAAGYSRAIQRVPSKVFDKPYVRRKVEDVVRAMEEERDAIIELMKKKRSKANYAVLSITLKNMNHDIELLEGRPTERDDGGLDAKEKADLQALLARHRKK